MGNCCTDEEEPPSPRTYDENTFAYCKSCAKWVDVGRGHTCVPPTIVEREPQPYRRRYWSHTEYETAAVAANEPM